MLLCAEVPAGRGVRGRRPRGAGARVGGGPVSQEHACSPKGSRHLVRPSFRVKCTARGFIHGADNYLRCAVRQAWGERDWECGLNQAGGVLASSGLKSLWKTDEKQVSLVLIGEEEFRFFLWNKLHSVGDCQGPHCAPEIRSVKVCWGGGDGLPRST